MALLTGISLENFKGISNRVSIPLRPLTLLFGANSAGKSTILQAILYALEVIRTGQVDLDRVTFGGDSIDLGGFKNLVHGHDANRTMRLRFDMDFSNADLTRRVEIDEFLYEVGEEQKKSVMDLSTIGDFTDTGWVEFHIGVLPETQSAPKVLFWEVGLDGIWLARIGNWENRVTLGNRTATAVLNEVHPILSLPQDKERTGNIYGVIGEFAQTEFYELYFSSTAFNLPDKFEPKILLKAIADEHGEDAANDFKEYEEQVFNPRDLFLPETLRASVAPDGIAVVEIGILEFDGGLAVHRAFSMKGKKSSYLLKINSVDRCPDLQNMRGCMPNWEEPFKAGWPLTVYSKTEVRETGSEEDARTLAHAQFLSQVIERLCIGPLLLLKDELSKFRYVGPVRDIVPRNFIALRSLDNDRWSNGYAAWDALYRDIEQHEDPDEMLLVKGTSDYLSEKLGLGYKISAEKNYLLPSDHPILSELNLLAARYEERNAQYVRSKIINQISVLDTEKRLRITDERNGVNVEPNDIGVGVSQVLPIIVGAMEKSAPILAVEQPELHVHPAVACNLGDLFIREFVGQNRICLIETHSEHLVLRIMKRMRESLTNDIPEGIPKITPEEVTILYVENVDGRTIMRNMPLNERGELVKAWPGGFFEEALRETL